MSRCLSTSCIADELRDAVLDTNDLCPRVFTHLTLQDICSAVAVCRTFRASADVAIALLQKEDWWISAPAGVAEERIREVLAALQTRNAMGASNFPGCKRSTLLESSGTCAVRVKASCVGLATAWKTAIHTTNRSNSETAIDALDCILRWIFVPEVPSKIHDAFELHNTIDVFMTLVHYFESNSKRIRLYFHSLAIIKDIIKPNLTPLCHISCVTNFQNLSAIERFTRIGGFFTQEMARHLIRHLMNPEIANLVSNEFQVHKKLLQMILTLNRPGNAPALIIRWAKRIESAPESEQKELYELVGRILTDANPERRLAHAPGFLPVPEADRRLHVGVSCHL